MSNQSKWTENDFGEMSWHDCNIDAMALDQEGEWQSDLVLSLDYIVEWLCGVDKTCRFRIAPAVLRFANVDNLRLDVSLTFKQPLEIYTIERSEIPAKGYKNYHWTIKLQAFPGLNDNVIEFDATGFIQELTGKVIESNAQHLTGDQRRDCHKECQTRIGNVP
jgi:hypothetical protein